MQQDDLEDTHWVSAAVPDLAWTDLFDQPPLGWQDLESPSAVAAGTAWPQSGRTALLRVLSSVVPQEPNWVVNVLHADAARITVTPSVPLAWDPRLFGIQAPRR